MKFKYLAISGNDELQKGVLSTNSEQEARSILAKKGLSVLTIEKQKLGFFQKELALGHVTHLDLLFFVKHLSIMLRAGVPLFESLVMLEEQAKGVLKTHLKKVLESVAAGGTLSEALMKYPKDFPRLFVQLISMGEMSGTLESNLDYVSRFIQREMELKKKVKGAMLYPGIVFGSVFVLVMVIGLFILPQILPLFGSLKVELPLSTKLLIWCAEFFESYGVHTLVTLVASGFLIPLLLEFSWIRPLSHGMYVRLPVAGKILRELNLARIFHVMATLMQAGITIDKALLSTQRVLRNEGYKRSLNDLAAQVMKGDPMYKAIKDFPFLYPIIVAHMMKVGEKTGNLVDSFNYLGDYFAEEVDEKLKNLSTILEPILLLFIGLIVGGVAFAVIGPIYSLSGGIA